MLVGDVFVLFFVFAKKVESSRAKVGEGGGKQIAYVCIDENHTKRGSVLLHLVMHVLGNLVACADVTLSVCMWGTPLLLFFFRCRNALHTHRARAVLFCGSHLLYDFYSALCIPPPPRACGVLPESLAVCFYIRCMIETHGCHYCR